MDDSLVEMGDRAFLRWNARLEPDQLQPGEVSVSVNGRMDRGVWQQRPAIRNLSGALEIDGTPLRLPFFLVDTVGGRDLSPGTLTVSGATSPAGMNGTFSVGASLSNAVNGRIAYSLDSDPDYQIFWTGTKWQGGDINSLAYWESAEDVVSPDLVVTWTNVGTTGTLSVVAASEGAERVDAAVTLYCSAHGFDTAADLTYLGVEGLTGTVSPNGSQQMTVIDEATLSFLITGATGSETYTGTGKLRSVLDDTEAAAIFGSCLFSDPADDSDEFIIEAATGVAFKVAVADGTVTEIEYPTGLVLSGEVDLVQAFDRVFLFRDGSQSWEWFGTKGRSVSAAALASNVITVTLKAHGLTAGDSVVLSDIGFVTTDPNGTRVVASIPTADTFTFALTGADEPYTVNTGTAVTGFTKVQAGDYTQPQVFEVTGGDVDVVSGLVTMTVSGNTTVEVGDTVTIYGTDETNWLELLGRQFLVTAASTTAISFYAAVPDTTGIGASYISFGRQISVGAGFRNMPAPPWGVYHQRRLIVPYRYTQTGTTASPTFTDREVRDELVISDILDPYTYDSIANQFRVTAGIADFLVAFQPFYEDGLVVFNRNSLHLISGLSGSLADCSVNELTREIGCLARKSIAQHGAEILFLSDNGVYQVGFIDRYNLRGVEVPLSDAIQPIIDRINPDLAGDSVGVFFANRYYIAVPLDSAAGAGDATGNNAILVYNFLNQGWESLDTVDDDRWDVLNFHIARSGVRNDLYAVNSSGGVHKIDAADSDLDELALSPGEDLESIRVNSELTTRQFDGETLERKRFTELQVMTGNSGLNADADFVFTCEDVDASVTVGSVLTLLGEVLSPAEDASLRGRIGGVRGQAGTVTVSSVIGRPKIRSVKLTATAAFGSTTSVK